MAVTTILIFETDRVKKDVLFVACLASLIFWLISNGLWYFCRVPIDPTLCFKLQLLTYDTFSFITLLTLPVQTNEVLLRTFNFFDFSYFVESLFFIINYIIDSDRPPHTIFYIIFAYYGAYNRGNLKVIINVSKCKVTNFGRLRHNFLLLFCFLYGFLPIHQLVSIIWFWVIWIIIYIFTKSYILVKL